MHQCLARFCFERSFLRFFIGLLALTILTACGHNFNARADTNNHPDPYFTDRDFVKKGVPENGDRIDDWIGKIATWDGTQYNFYNKPYLKNNNRPVVMAEQKNYSYHATIDSNWKFGLSVPFVQADASGQTASEVMVIDTANVAVAPDDEVERGDSFDAEAKKRGIANPSAQGLYWVKGVALEVVTIKLGTKLSFFQNVNGDGFGASGGEAYDANEAQTFPLVSVLAIPMNAKADEEVKDRQAKHDIARDNYMKSISMIAKDTRALNRLVGTSAKLKADGSIEVPRIRIKPALRLDPKTGLVPHRLLP